MIWTIGKLVNRTMMLRCRMCCSSPSLNTTLSLPQPFLTTPTILPSITSWHGISSTASTSQLRWLSSALPSNPNKPNTPSSPSPPVSTPTPTASSSSSSPSRKPGKSGSRSKSKRKTDVSMDSESDIEELMEHQFENYPSPLNIIPSSSSSSTSSSSSSSSPSSPGHSHSRRTFGILPPRWSIERYRLRDEGYKTLLRAGSIYISSSFAMWSAPTQKTRALHKVWQSHDGMILIINV